VGYFIVMLLAFCAGYGFGWVKGVNMNKDGFR
jgi:hypothetical protein